MPAPHRVSVVIPAYKSAAFIDDALAGIASQTLPAAEVIVVDDGSPDDTASRAEGWADRLAPARLIVLRGPNEKLPAARNRGVLASTGDIIAFLDADDVFLPDHLATLVPAFELDPRLVLAFSDSVRWGGSEDGVPMLRPIRERLRQISLPTADGAIQLLGPELRAVYLSARRIIPSTWLIARNGLACTGLFDPALAYGEDTEFLTRLLATGAAAWTDRVTVKKRDHGANLSGPQRAVLNEAELVYLFSKMRRFNRGLTPEERHVVDACIRLSVQHMEYHASQAGLGAYLRARKQIRFWRGRPALWSPRSLIRAALSG